MSAKVTVVDYGMGNLLSVRRAFEHCGAEVELTDQAAAIARAQRLVLPGVGAFKDGMAGLHALGLIEPIRGFAASGRPFLGICLGMQMMFDASEEYGEYAGLGLIAGRIVAIPPRGPGELTRKIPHIGWTALAAPASGRGWAPTILADAVPGRTAVYFVHSFHARPGADADALAVCDYAGCTVMAAVAHANVSGCQYHPEKSGEAGLAMIRRFLAQPAR
jgi:glutamine amidotransferase